MTTGSRRAGRDLPLSGRPEPAARRYDGGTRDEADVLDPSPHPLGRRGLQDARGVSGDGVAPPPSRAAASRRRSGLPLHGRPVVLRPSTPRTLSPSGGGSPAITLR